MTFSFKPLPPEDALKFWKDKVPMGKKAFTRLAESERVKAFVVAGMAKGDMLTAIHHSIGAALSTGQSFNAWKKDINDLFKAKGWGPLSGYRLDTIFRTNIQTAYATGRYAQMMDAVKTRPFWRYSAVNDRRTRPVHRALNGRVVRADDPFWDTFYPPNGFRCFPPGTLVRTRSGWAPIESICIDDRVIGGSGQEQRVTAVHLNRFNGDLVRLVFKNGRIDTTPNHRVLTMDGWVRADRLKAGDVLVETVDLVFVNSVVGNIDQGGAFLDGFNTLDGFRAWARSHCNLRKVRFLSRIPYTGNVYNISVDNDESYVIPGATVHNCRCTVTSLSKREMDKKGYKPESIKPGDMIEPKDNKGKPVGPPVYAMPDKHFQTNPAMDYWQADTTRFRADVREMVLKSFVRACPDDFCGPCEFAETDCFKRLKRHLTQADLEDLQTVVWADGEKARRGFGEWVDQVVKSRQSKGELYPVGTLPAKVLQALKKQPRLALVTMDDKQLNHLIRDKKADRNATLTPDEIKQIPDQLAQARWWRDKKKDNYLMTWVRTGNVWLKVVINMDYRIDNSKKRIANHVITCGVVKESDIEKVSRYEEI